MFVLYVADKALLPNLAPNKGWHVRARAPTRMFIKTH